MISTHPSAHFSRKIGAHFLGFHVQRWILGAGGEEVQFRSNFGQKIDRKSVKIDVKWVVVAPFGLIFNQHEATAHRNFFRPLPGSKTTIFYPKTVKNDKNR